MNWHYHERDKLPWTYKAAEIVATTPVSSAIAERVFSVYRTKSSKQQQSPKIDRKELCMMLTINDRERDKEDKWRNGLEEENMEVHVLYNNDDGNSDEDSDDNNDDDL